jgi:cation diffusion facilitator CzcD-associated flavoprotein CzcO
MAETAAHVTMLQRSPTYVVAVPSRDPIANRLRRVLGARATYPIARWKNVLIGTVFYRLSRTRPELIKRAIRRGLVRALPAGYDIDTHFKPRYQPWDQRLCMAPDGDLFRAIRHGDASVVTDQIETFTADGIRLASGTELPADVVVSATGLNLLLFGGATLDVDGVAVDPANTLAYKGMMLSGVPNFAFTIGYTNASWTLKADLVSEYVCRLLARMDERGAAIATPINDDPVMETRPLMDFAAGYVQRSVHQLPKNGSRKPWQLGMSYAHDVVTLRHGRVDDGIMRFAGGSRP